MMAFSQRIILIFVTLLIYPTCHAQGWEEVQRIEASDKEAEARFGSDVAISGDNAIICSRFDSDAAFPLDENIPKKSSLYFYRKENGSERWIEMQRIEPSSLDDGEFFTNSLDIYGNNAMIGAIKITEDTMAEQSITVHGSIYAYQFNEETNQWNPFQKLGFGGSIDIYRNYAIIGSSSESTNEEGENPISRAGAAYIFRLDSNANQWIEIQKIVASDRAENRSFGRSVAIFEDRVIIGASHASISSAYIFEKQQSGEWVEKQVLTGTDQQLGDVFGGSVDIFGDYAVVGAFDNEYDENGENRIDGSGSAYIFNRNEDGHWLEIQKITAQPRRNEEFFGISVAINNTHILVGAIDFGYYFQGAGTVRAFESDEDGIWQQTKIIHPSYAPLSGARFGASLDLDGDHFIVGAPGLSEVRPPDGQFFDENIGNIFIFEYTDTIVATDDIRFDFPIKVFPNPTDGPIYVDMGISYPEIQVEISNSLGQTIYRKKEKTAQQLNLDLDGYPTGIYYISIQDGDGRSARIKVVRE